LCFASVSVHRGMAQGLYDAISTALTLTAASPAAVGPTDFTPPLAVPSLQLASARKQKDLADASKV
jgi:hypothetical protein